VYFESESNIVVGQIAKDIAKIHPGLIAETVKRHMGDANWVRTFGGRAYRPQDVSALILRKVVGDAEKVLGQAIEDVVVTCPAYFGNVEKEATRQAGAIAGLNVRCVVPEPMAAAFAYGLDAIEGQTFWSTISAEVRLMARCSACPAQFYPLSATVISAGKTGTKIS
jgi:molecular chaperone DnaK